MHSKKNQRIAVITGGRSGIGPAIAKTLAANGMRSISSIKGDKSEPKEDIQMDTYYRFCNVSQAQNIKALYQLVIQEFGIKDILVLNAGRSIPQKLHDGHPKKRKTLLNTKLQEALRCVKAFVPHMPERKIGNVIFISSGSANQPHPYIEIYSAPKTALETNAEILRLETIPYIHHTAICHDITNTSFFKNQISSKRSASDLNMGCITNDKFAEEVFYIINKKPTTSAKKMLTRPIA